jgi:DNA-binding response OmpR family regulator
MTMTASASAQLRQMEHPQLQGHQVWYSDQQHLLIVDGVVIPCTPSEYDVLLILLRATGEPVPLRTYCIETRSRRFRWEAAIASPSA